MTAGTYRIVRATAAFLALAAAGARADDGPAIAAAAVDYTGNRLTISGSNFSPTGAAPIVLFDNAELQLISFNNRQAAANLPSGWTTGSYLLQVTNSDHRTGEFRITIAAPLAKLRYHARALYGPWAIAGTFAYAGILQAWNAPREWGQGAGAYGRRVASTEGAAAIHTVLAFGIDSALHQDPRYYRSGRRGFFRRMGYAARGTFLTRTDSGGETVATWRLGSAYGAAFLSNLWYPDRLNTVRLGLVQGTVRLGFDLVTNLSAEFWPDLKKKLRRH